MSRLSEYKLAFIDLETTGLDETQHEIIELAAIVYNQKTTKTKEWSVKIAPTHIETASPNALKINGYLNSPGAYIADIKSALIKFNSMIKDCIIIGQTPDFDLRFIKKNMSDLGINLSCDYRKLDIMSLAWWVVKDSDIPGLSLKKICDYFGVSNEGEHSALVDCRRALRIYNILTAEYDLWKNNNQQ